MSAPATVTELMNAGYWNPARYPSTGDFRHPDNGEFDDLAVQIAAVIGEERASLPATQRRFAVCTKTGAPLLVLDCPRKWISPGDANYVVAPEDGAAMQEWLAVEQRAFPVAEAVALLNSPESPERELRRRRELVRARDAIREQRDAEAEKRARAEREAAEKSRRYRASDWGQLPLARRMAYSLSLALEDSDPKLAEEIRNVAEHGEHLPCPELQWWRAKGQRVTVE